MWQYMIYSGEDKYNNKNSFHVIWMLDSTRVFTTLLYVKWATVHLFRSIICGIILFDSDIYSPFDLPSQYLEREQYRQLA